jgi:hypothetical protein
MHYPTIPVKSSHYNTLKSPYTVNHSIVLRDLLQLEVWLLLHGVVKITNFRLMDDFHPSLCCLLWFTHTIIKCEVCEDVL